jgi:hypothetical protein
VTGAVRLGSTVLSAIVLVAVNLIPLVGVAFWGWSLMLILVLYWIESGIVGVINIFKIAKAQGEATTPFTVNGNRITIRLSGMSSTFAKGSLIGFFVLHYGIFWVVHGVFVFLLPLFASISSPATDLSDPSFPFRSVNFGPLPLDALLLSAMLLAASHVVSYFTNFIGRDEYLRVTPQGQMLSVYGRVVVLHVTIVAGAGLVGAFGTPFAALVLLIGLKTVIDLVLHLREHRPATNGSTAISG